MALHDATLIETMQVITMPTTVTDADTKRPRRETLNLRIKPEERQLIDRAAKIRGKNRTAFVLDAAHVAAEEALLEQALTCVDAQAYAKFLARLDSPAQPNERLRETMQAPAPWDRA